MRQVRFIIPEIPPSVNSAYMRTKFGSRIIKREGREFKELVNECIKKQVIEKDGEYQGHREPIFDSGVQVDIILYMPDEYRFTDSDIDNRLKILMDAIENKVSYKRKYTYKGKIFKDDKQIDKLTVERVIDYRYPRTEVTVSEFKRKVITYTKSVEQKRLK